MPSIVLCFVVVLGITSFSQSAHAQAVPGEAALNHGDLRGARKLATQAIEAGGRSAAELVPLYRVLAVANARLDDVDGSRRAFTVALALDPAFRLEANAPDEVRSPYMEARGDWSSRGTPLGARVLVADDRSGVLVYVDDPAGLSARLRFRRQVGDSVQFVETVLPTASNLSLPVAQLERAVAIKYSLALLDEHGNRLWELGTPERPERLVLPGPAQVPSSASTSPVGAALPPTSNARPYYIVGSLSLVAAAGLLGGAVYTHLEREQLAGAWNTGDCQGKGTTRGMICSDEGRRVVRMERISQALYGAGAAALIAGSVLLMLAPASSSDDARAVRAHSSDWRLTSGPGDLGMACSTAF